MSPTTSSARAAPPSRGTGPVPPASCAGAVPCSRLSSPGRPRDTARGTSSPSPARPALRRLAAAPLHQGQPEPVQHGPAGPAVGCQTLFQQGRRLVVAAGTVRQRPLLGQRPERLPGLLELAFRLLSRQGGLLDRFGRQGAGAGASRSASGSSAGTSSAAKATRLPPPRLAAFRARAWSMRMRRIPSAAARMK